MQRNTSKLLSGLPLRHAVYLREGIDAATEESRQLIAEDIDCTGQLYSVHQIHGKDVIVVTASSSLMAGTGDAMITNIPGKGLIIKHADCQAAIIYDPDHHAVANVHSGWRGSVANIYAATIAAMQQHYESDPRNLLVYVGPSLGPTAAEFVNYQQELPESFWKFKRTDHHFDFWAITEWQLKECGVTAENIEMARICTYSNPKDYYSYRRNKDTGRNATVVMLSAR